MGRSKVLDVDLTHSIRWSRRLCLARGLTARSEAMNSFACSRDIIGLLNQALSGRPTRPLLAVLEARPMMIESLGEASVITLVKSLSSLRGVRVTTAVEACQRMLVVF